jgi:hypothetical protein
VGFEEVKKGNKNHLKYSQFDEIKKFQTLGFDIFKLRQQSKGNTVVAVIMHAMENQQLWDKTNTDRSRMKNLCIGI